MSKEAIDILMEKSHSPKRRMDAIVALTENFNPEYFCVFEEVFQDTSDHPDVRSALALTFGKLGTYMESDDNPCLNVLLHFAKDESVTVRNYIVQALGILAREEAIPVLIKALEDDDNVVFHSAADALGRIGRAVVPHLIQLLKEGADDARCIAAWKLGELRYIEAIPDLLQVLESDDNNELKALSVWALGEIGRDSPEVLSVLNELKSHEDPELHERAKLAMKKIARHSN